MKGNTVTKTKSVLFIALTGCVHNDHIMVRYYIKTKPSEHKTMNPLPLVDAKMS
jgi:hypothetical protein